MTTHRLRKTVLAIGDLHKPWHSRATLLAIYRAIRRIKPDVVIQMGDLYDLFSFTRFPRTHNVYTPSQELTLARKDAELFWQSVKYAAPKNCKRIQLWGNHDDRAVKSALSRSPELEHFVAEGMASLMKFPGVQTVDDSRHVLMIDGVGYHHGYLLNPGAHARANLCNMVCAHTHYGCVIPLKLEDRIIWELNVGFGADRFAKPLGYAPQRRFSRSTLGFGVVDPYGPRFYPLQTEVRPRDP